MTEEDLTEYFQQYGVIHEVMVGRTGDVTKNNGVGFVIFKDPKSLTSAMKHQEDNGIAKHLVQERLIECEAACTGEVCRFNICLFVCLFVVVVDKAGGTSMWFPAPLVSHHFPLTKEAGTGKAKSVFHWLNIILQARELF